MRLPMEDDAARMLPPSLVGNISACSALLRAQLIYGSLCSRTRFVIPQQSESSWKDRETLLPVGSSSFDQQTRRSRSRS